MGDVSSDFQLERDYVALFHEHLDISVREERYRVPAEQPATVEDRYGVAATEVREFTRVFPVSLLEVDDETKRLNRHQRPKPTRFHSYAEPATAGGELFRTPGER